MSQSALVLLALLAQSKPEQAKMNSAKAEGGQVVNLLHAGMSDVPPDVIEKDAMTVQKVTLDPAWAKSTGKVITVGERDKAAAAAWGAARTKKTSNSAPLTVTEYRASAFNMGRLQVKSTPTGGSVAVDGYNWPNQTDADGFAESGQRTVVVTRGPASLTVQCNVRQDGTVTANLNFQNQTAECK